MNSSIFDRRRAGLLIPAYALRREGDLGIGDTLAVREAIDFCADLGFGVLQLLPILETFQDPSPYSPISSMALSPQLLALTPEETPGLLAEDLLRLAPPAWLDELRQGNVKHAAIRALKEELLAGAFLNFKENQNAGLWDEFESFREREAEWLRPYTLYRTLVDLYGGTEWHDWRPEHHQVATAEDWLATREPDDPAHHARNLHAYVQWVAWRQWSAVRRHADALGVKLIGDLTFGISGTSCDAWSWPEWFDPAWHLGTPPLAHFETNPTAERWGQNWNLPAYRWENHRADGFRWLLRRVGRHRELFHGCRIDHLRGYFRTYQFPWAGAARHAEFSNLSEAEAKLLTGGLLPRFIPGPDDDSTTAALNDLQGREIIGHLIEEAGEMDLVAEIMGSMPDYMARALDDLQLANLRFPQLEREADGTIRSPATFRELGLITYANHDNAPLALQYLKLLEDHRNDPASPKGRELTAWLEFCGWRDTPPETLTAELLGHLQDALFSTSSRLAMLMISDLFGIPLRFNLPGTYGEDIWSDRLPMTLDAFRHHAVYGPRIQTAAALVARHGRHLVPPGGLEPPRP